MSATPGPWFVTAVAGGWDGVKADNGEIICRLSYNEPANAHLIAAAPELLAAAEQSREHLIDMGPQGCEGEGRVPFVRTHNATRYDNCAVCHGSGRTEARREIYPFGREHLGKWFVLGWPNQGFASKEAAALAIVAALTPAPVVEPAPRSQAEVWAGVLLDGPR